MRRLILFFVCVAICSPAFGDEWLFNQNFNALNAGDTGLFADGSRAVDSGEGSAEVYDAFAIGNQRTALRLTGKASPFSGTTANYFIEPQSVTGQLDSWSANWDQMAFSSNGSTGNHMAFNFGDLTNTTSSYVSSDGTMQVSGKGDNVLSVVFDSLDDEIQVWYDGSQVGSSIGTPNIETSNSSQLFTDVNVSWTRSGGLNVIYGGSTLVSALSITGYDPGGDDIMAFSADNGDTNRQSTYLDNINLFTSVPEPTSAVMFSALMLGALLTNRRSR